jgi:predicted transcriptional regulator
MVDPERSIFDETDDEADEIALREGEADADAGRVVPHDEVATWLDTWGTPHFKPAPKAWFK